jgi:hypothetical protein
MELKKKWKSADELGLFQGTVTQKPEWVITLELIQPPIEWPPKVNQKLFDREIEHIMAHGVSTPLTLLRKQGTVSSNYSKEKRDKVRKQLFEKQKGLCHWCQKPMVWTTRAAASRRSNTCCRAATEGGLPLITLCLRTRRAIITAKANGTGLRAMRTILCCRVAGMGLFLASVAVTCHFTETLKCLGPGPKREGRTGRVLGPFMVPAGQPLPSPVPSLEVVTPAGRFLWVQVPDDLVDEQARKGA